MHRVDEPHERTCRERPSFVEAHPLPVNPGGDEGGGEASLLDTGAHISLNEREEKLAMRVSLMFFPSLTRRGLR